MNWIKKDQLLYRVDDISYFQSYTTSKNESYIRIVFQKDFYRELCYKNPELRDFIFQEICQRIKNKEEFIDLDELQNNFVGSMNSLEELQQQEKNNTIGARL